MTDELQGLKETLLQGMKKSLQGSYARRSPASDSVGLLETARRGLRELVKQDENNAEALRLLSQAEECLLNYRKAIACLEQAMSLSGSRTKHDLKRLALLRGSLQEWDALPLSPDQLRNLGEFLVRAGADNEATGRSLESTRRWLTENNIPSPEALIEALGIRGAYTDFQVLYNVVRG
jgi:hypothetical protein